MGQWDTLYRCPLSGLFWFARQLRSAWYFVNTIVQAFRSCMRCTSKSKIHCLANQNKPDNGQWHRVSRRVIGAIPGKILTPPPYIHIFYRTPLTHFINFDTPLLTYIFFIGPPYAFYNCALDPHSLHTYFSLRPPLPIL